MEQLISELDSRCEMTAVGPPPAHLLDVTRLDRGKRERASNPPCTIDPDGHWRMIPGVSRETWNITVQGKKLGVYQYLWRYYAGQTLPPRHFTVRECEDDSCVSPFHRTLSSNDGTWTSADWNRLEKALLANSEIVQASETTSKALSSLGQPVSDCRLWTGRVVGDYGVLSYKDKNKPVHRWTLIHKLKDRTLPRNIHARHLCGAPLCVNPDHLASGTAKDNYNDRVAHGTANIGENSQLATLDSKAVLAIYAAKAGELSGRQVGELHGVTESAVFNIWKGRSWRATTGQSDLTVRKEKTVVSLGERWDDAKAFLERITFVDEASNCWTCTRKSMQNGYVLTKFNGTMYMAHRLSWMAHNRSYIPPGLVVRHGKGCKGTCINPAHLTIGTDGDNGNDRVLHGTSRKGELSSNAKLDEATVKLIKASAGSVTVSERAVRFGCTKRAIYHIDRGETWAHVTLTESNLLVTPEAE